MKYRAICSVLIILVFFTTQINASSLLLGSIKFPVTIKNIIPLPMFFGGRMITSKVITNSHEIVYEVPIFNGQHVFHILITEQHKSQEKILSITPDIHNTFDYLYVPEGQQYKLYELVPVIDTKNDQNKSSIPLVRWNIKEAALPENGQIPDHAIIIWYLPHLVEKLEGGSILELPTIIMRSDILSLVESEKAFAEEMVKLQLAALDAKTIHAPPAERPIQHNTSKTIVIGCIV